MFNLHNERKKGHGDLNSDVKSVLISQIIQIVCFWVFNSRELVNIIDNCIKVNLHATWAKELRTKRANSQINLFRACPGRVVLLLASLCYFR
jgi:hypothetical protein